MAAVLQNLLDILGNPLSRCLSARLLLGAFSRCLSARLLLGAFSRCLSARLLLGAFSRCLSARLLLGAFSRCLSARLLLGAFSRCLSARLLLGAFNRLFGACAFRRRGKPLPRLRLCWPGETGINLGRKTQGFFVICFGVRHLSLLLVSQASTRIGRDEVWQNQNSLVEIFHRAADIAGLAQSSAA